MGSSSSRLGPRSSRPRDYRSNISLFSFICGGSNSHTPIEMEDYSADLLVNYSENCDPVGIAEPQSSMMEFSSIFNAEIGCSCSEAENRAPSASNNGSIEDTSMEYGSRSIETNTDGDSLSGSKELVRCQVSSPIERTSDVASTSFKEWQSLESLSVNVGPNLNSFIGIDDSKNEGGSQICSQGTCSSSAFHQELGDSCANAVSSIENHTDEILGVHNSDRDSFPVVSDTPTTLQSLGDESVHEVVPPAPGFLMPDRQQDRRNGSVLHVDVVSISSNILFSSTGEVSNHEARRNSSRLFWDAFSRGSSISHSDSPTIVFSTEDADDLESQDRWLLDFSSDLFEDGFGGNSGYFSSNGHGVYGQQRNSRPETWERFRGLDESGRYITLCASGLHRDGTCLCESFLMTEESGTRASISRIVMLAEALFEVLDEIHHQPVPLSLLVPAPESVVNSFPLKSHQRLDTAESVNDIEQCYICLAEYEDGDKIRVLPCRHEYHMTCVDKWLKEIHGICPLCRRDVCEGVAEGSASNL